MTRRAPPRHVEHLQKNEAKFHQWIVANGAQVQPPTNSYEVLRVKSPNGVAVVYQKASGSLTWPDVLSKAWLAWQNGDEAFKGFVSAKKRKLNRKRMVDALAHRDGRACFYCGIVLPVGEETIEHLLSAAHGGSSRIENLVLSCTPCNREAGHMCVAHKVKLREGKKRACA